MGAAFQRMYDQMAMALINSLMQMAEQEIAHLALHKAIGAETRMDDARTAAGNAFKWASSWGGPVAGAIAGSVAFAAVAAYQDGADMIPRAGLAILHPGEAVATAGENSRISKVIALAANGGVGGSDGAHFHYSPNINGIDGASVESMAKNHANTFKRQMVRELRRMNKI